MSEPIAITGSACRFPGGASSPSKLWDLLREPRDVLREFRKDELNLAGFYHPDGDHHGTTDVCNKGYLLQEDSRLFDAAFFSVNPAEAEAMDPQQRITLETVYEALESAGYTLNGIQGSKTSVYVGVMTGDYYDIQLRDSETIGRYHGTGTARSILSNRISYFFNLKGPSVTIDTACSSSLAALHFAVQSLRQNESTTAIVAGANIILDAPMYIAESKLHMLSPTSRSQMWDKSANGYARGEGMAAVVLKTLSQAIRDGDHIECIIRETGMNSDGRTKGITMPSSTAQARLIQDTYRRAGLDAYTDRPQYFECHGTGTQAGDPVEAQAIHEAFFQDSHQLTESMKTGSGKLFCGSIKTVIGHTEGCAGLAGLLKASLAVQHGIVPPNLLFNELNPAIIPFYGQLEVPTAPMSWPEAADGIRRASVNSFGFGGTNVHAIVENYVSESPKIDMSLTESAGSSELIGPLVFSAQSGPSLARTVAEFMAYINAHPEIDLEDLACVLRNRRTEFSTKISFSGSTRERLLKSMETSVSSLSNADVFGIKALANDPNNPPGIIGIFTGQGAQWATMGRQLIKSCRLFRDSIRESENALTSIPEAPEWSLMSELLADEDASRIAEAAISQPLCTAIQIALVKLLSASGISFNAVVGHSSGEIAAVYAAGMISASDAMRIAYYRGLYAKCASGPDGKAGGMMAVGLSHEAASSFCDEPQFAGRICLAASNSPNSVTLSGDLDAIHEAKALFDERNTFARLLKVDTAYHSHHMLSASQKYLDSLLACDIRISPPSDDCIWVSSVRGDAEMIEEDDLESLTGPYWVENMVKPVLFLDAVECAHIKGGPFDMAIEVGPHPALKGPTTEIFKTSLGSGLPYAAFLRRGCDDLEAFSDGIGYCWSHFNPSLVDFSGYLDSFHRDGGGPRPGQRILKGLPSYSWNHDRVYWKESRPARNYRQLGEVPHEILGRRVAVDVADEMRWRNILRLSELPWVRGHAFQGQTLFPTSGYMAMAIQAARIIAEERPVKLIEVLNLVIDKALTLEENHPGVETIFSTKRVKNLAGDDSKLLAEFTCDAAAANDAHGSMELKCSGQILVTFGLSSPNELPPKRLPKSGLASFNAENYYDSLLKIGLDYQGLFRGMKEVNRRMHYANTKASWLEAHLGLDYIIHPGPLDVAFHSVIAAYCTPDSDTLWASFLPTKVSRLAIVPDMDYRNELGEIDFDIDTYVTKTTSNSFDGDIHIHNLSGCTGVQVEGLTLKMFTEARASNDRPMFSTVMWDSDILAGPDNLTPRLPDEDELALAEAIDRTSLFYFQQVFDQIAPSDAAEFPWHHQCFYQEANKILAEVRNGQHPVGKKAWLADKPEHIMEMKRRYQGQADLTLIHAVGENLGAVLRGETQLLEVMLKDNMLSDLYSKGSATAPLNQRIAELMRQLTFKYPRTDILEIGAGTGGTTRSILDSIKDSYASYTYTDVSSGFFEKANERFLDHKTRMKFKVLNIERDPTEQGFTDESYDVIIAANVLHATRKLGETLLHTRKLLKPGGYLIMMEVTGQMLEMTFLMGGLPGWWLGVDDGRLRSPAVSLVTWDKMLKEAGFTGVDKFVSNLPDPVKHSCSVIVSQYLDEEAALLRDPLSSLGTIPDEERLLVIGGKTLPVARLVDGIARLSAQFTGHLRVIDDVDVVGNEDLVSNVSVICVSELDKPLFAETLTPERLKALQTLFANATNVLWITSGRLSHSALSNMTVGLGRALMTELPQLNLQFLEVALPGTLTARKTVEVFLRLKLANETQFLNKNMLWVTEPELMLENDTLLVPRVILDKVRNDRFNSQRRAIKRRVSVSDRVPVKIVSVDGKLAPQEDFSTIKRLKSPESKDVAIVVKQSISLPQLEQEEPYFLCLGTVVNDKSPVAAISKSNSSTVIVSVEESFALPPTQDCGPALLRSLAAQLVADVLASSFHKSATILVYRTAESVFASALKRRIELNGGKCFFVGVDKMADIDNYVQVHPNDSQFALQEALPPNVDHFIDLTNPADNNNSSSSSNRVRSCLSKLFPAVRFRSSLLPTSRLHQLLAEAYSLAVTSSPLHSTPSLEQTHVSQLDTQPVERGRYPHVLNWEGAGQLNVAVKPLDFTGFFSAKKTYLMIGLTSDLGRSLCRWMVQNGAKHIVLASRNANIDPAWLDEMRHVGANVQVYKMDVSNKDSVLSVCDAIKSTLPPVAGVCNGALVLSDKLFVEMDVDDINDIWKPKVDGSMHLHEYFKNHDLDFFILFSSISGVVGNGGQSNYNAASLFQTTLVAQRRAVGLPGSVLSLGMVTDVGYIAQRGPKLMERLKSQFYLPISEDALHIIFAESILASSPHSDAGEVISGISPFTYSAKTQSRPAWSSNPRLSHLVRQEDDSAQEVQLALSTVHIREQLDHADSLEAAISALTVAFSAKLEAMLQITPTSLNVESPLIVVGIDSLLAVEIRTWFLKEVFVDVPVLKILGGETSASLCSFAAREYLESMRQKRQRDAAESKVEESDTPAREASLDTQEASHSTASTVDFQTSLATSILSSESSSGSGDKPADSVTTNGMSDTESQALFVERLQRVETMSHAQSRTWFACRFLKDSTAYNNINVYDIKGTLQIPRFRRAMDQVLSHHDIFRTCFFEREPNSEPVQGLMEPRQFSFNHIADPASDTVEQEVQKLRSQVWNLERGDTFKATLITRSPGHHTLVFGYHHIIMDGFSLHIFLQDLNSAYQGKPLDSTVAQYMDISEAERLSIANNELNDQIRYWKQEYAQPLDIMPLLPFSSVKMRKVTDDYSNHTVERVLDSDLTTLVKNASQSLGITPFRFHLSAMQVLFNKLLNVEDMCIGVTDANRSDLSKSTVGFFVNLLAIRLFASRNDQFGDLVKRTSQKYFSAAANSKVPFDVLLDELNLARSPTHNPLFQVLLNYRQGRFDQLPIGGSKMEAKHAQDAKSLYDLLFSVTLTGTTCHLEVSSRSYLYSSESTHMLVDLYASLLRNLAENPFQSLDQVRLVDAATASHKALGLGRGPRVEYCLPPTLTARFDSICETFGDDIAVVEGMISITYSQLAGLVHSISTAIVDLSLASGSRIAVLCEPSIQSLACMFSIFRTGCVCVPLDLSLPDSRHEAILRTCNPSMILCQTETLAQAEKLGSANTTIVDVTALSEGRIIANREQTNEPVLLLFTSGSTGTPKGIRLSQQGLISFTASIVEKLSLGREVVLQQSSSGFDISLSQIFGALLHGGKLVVVPRAMRGDPFELSKLLLTENVTVTIATPTEYLMLLTYGADNVHQATSWRHALTAGEPVTQQLKRQFRMLLNPPVVTDFYGPTEASIGATFHTVALEDQSSGDYGSVGKPMPNTSIYILDEKCQILPPGLPGEICIGGVGVALGYLDQDLTASMFLQDPSATPEDVARGWNIMYRTGDKGRLLQDGSVVFMGRTDGNTTIKLRGLRIDLDEISVAILNHREGMISYAVVSVRGDTSPFLVAHVVFAPGVSLDNAELQQLARELPLPDYMKPSLIVPLPQLPMNNNGKVDRLLIQTLPLPTPEAATVVAQGEFKPLNTAEMELKMLWNSLLGAAKVTLDSDFFTVGGSSLLLVKLQGAIRTSMGVRLSLVALYRASTLREMAALIVSEKDQQPTKDAIDWDSETALPDALFTTLELSQGTERVHSGPREVILTGATSFLGAEILKLLLENSGVAKVHCICVEPDHQATLPASEKVAVYTGSLAERNLGLTRAEYFMLQDNAHLIIHAGSHGHCLNNYESLRAPNYLSTQTLTALALPRLMPIHFLSSSRVALLSGKCDLPPVSVPENPPTDGSEGFTATKWASEAFLEKLAYKTSLRVCIHRTCGIVGDSAPDTDALNAFLHYSSLLGAVPRLDNMEGYLDFKKVGDVAAKIVENVLAPEYYQVEVAKPEFRHYSSGEKVSVKDIKGYLEKVLGQELEEVDIKDWVPRAYRSGMEEVIGSYLSTMVERDEKLFFPYMGEAL